jgi:hypothetical protein
MRLVAMTPGRYGFAVIRMARDPPPDTGCSVVGDSGFRRPVMGIAAIDGRAVPATELTVMIFPERSCRMMEALPEREAPVGGAPGFPKRTIQVLGEWDRPVKSNNKAISAFPLRVSAFEYQPGRGQGSKVWTPHTVCERLP